MPRIPQYESKRNVNTGPIAPAQNLATQDAANQNKILGTIQDVAQSWSDAHDVMQYSKAKADYEVRAEEIKQRAALDENFNNTPKYLEELNKAKSESLKGIDNNTVAGKAGQEISLSNSINGIKIEFANKQKELANNQHNVQEYVTAKVNDLPYATEAEKLSIQADVEDHLKLQVIQGVLSPQMAQKILLESKMASATNHVFSNPDEAISELQKKDGYYSELPLEKKSKLISTASDYKKRLQKEATQLQKDIILKNETDIAMAIAEGKPMNIGKLALKLENGTISSDFAQIALRVVTSPEPVGAYTNNDEFSALTKKLFASENKEQVHKSIMNILRGGGDGKLSKDDLEILLLSAINQPLEKRKELSNAVKTLGKWADETEGVDRADVLRDFQTKIKEEKSISEAVSESMQENTVKAVPKVVGFPKEGKLQIDKHGNKALVFPDGHYEEVK